MKKTDTILGWFLAAFLAFCIISLILQTTTFNPPWNLIGLVGAFVVLTFFVKTAL